MKSLLQDVRYGLRMLRKSPGFTAVAIITLALGIGANTAIFSLINAIMLRTLPVRDPQSLVLLKWTARRPEHAQGEYFWSGCPSDSGTSRTSCSFSYPMFQLIDADRQVFSGLFAFVPTRLAVNIDGQTSMLRGLFVSGESFSILGTHAAIGRLLGPLDDSIAASPAVVVSYRFWQKALGGNRMAVGKSILIGKTLFTIVGVASPSSLDLDPGIPRDFWLPLSSQPALAPYLPKRTAPNALWLELMGRLKPGISIARAASVLSTTFAAATTSGPEALFHPDDAPRVELPSAAHGLTSLRQEFSKSLYLLFVAVLIVLLIASANIAGFMLARSTARRKEVATRLVLGATRSRLVRLFLTESILLSAAGGMIGIFFGYWCAEALTTFLSHNGVIQLQVDVVPDSHVLAFTLLVSALVSSIFGLVPALTSRKLELVPALKEGSSTGTSRGSRITLGNTIVVGQMALAMLILSGAGLVVRTVNNLRNVDPGFNPNNLVLFRVDSTYSSYANGKLNVLNRELREKLAELPGVTLVSYSAIPLLSGGGISRSIVPERQSGAPVQVDLLPISADFFETMRIPLLAGRTLNGQDFNDKQSNGAHTDKAVVINETLARRLFGQQNPLARHFQVEGPTSPEEEVVGVVADGKYDSLRKDVQPTVYEAIGNDGATFEIRTAKDPKALMPAVRTAIARFDSNLLITDMKTQVEQIDQNIYQERLIANLSSLFALLALIVACVGIYGLLSYQVTRRTHEIGVRLALGAQRGDVLRLVIRQGAILAVLGAVIGIAAALAVTRYLQSFLFGVKPSDPVTIIAVAFGLIAVALLASYIPARRAMKTDPMVALRYE